jgi:hypothetical protein
VEEVEVAWTRWLRRSRQRRSVVLMAVKAGRTAWFPGTAVKAGRTTRFLYSSTWRRSEAPMWRRMWRRVCGGGERGGGAGADGCVAGNDSVRI